MVYRRIRNTFQYLLLLCQIGENRQFYRRMSINVSGSGLFLFSAVTSCLIASLNVRSTASSSLTKALLCFMAAIRLGDDILDAIGYTLSDSQIEDLLNRADKSGGFVQLSSESFVHVGVSQQLLSTIHTRHLDLGANNRLEILESIVKSMERELRATSNDPAQFSGIRNAFRNAFNCSFKSYAKERSYVRRCRLRDYDRVAYAKSSAIISHLVSCGRFIGDIKPERIEFVRRFFSAFALQLTMLDDLFDIASDWQKQPNFFWVCARENNEEISLLSILKRAKRLSFLHTIIQINECAPLTFAKWIGRLCLYRNTAKRYSPFYFPVIEGPYLAKYFKRLFLPF